ncbi:MAG: hypothetical protein H6932_12535 [Burkholderiaceae bacterium]|nr:hypothetical protein [Burkholderiaceae bacterium]
MPPSPDAHTLPVHPHQLEVQEFDAYALIVDLRSAADFARDHIPGAVSVPWHPVAVSTGEGTAVLGVAEPGSDLPRSLRVRLDALAPGDAVLLCCDRGGRDAAAMAQRLGAHGVMAHVLPGGWVNYARWVDVGLEVLTRVLNLVPLRGPTPAVIAVMATLEREGVQAVDLGAGQTLSVGRSNSGLVNLLRRMDPQRPVWVGLPEGDAGLPAVLHDALRRRAALQLVVGEATEATGQATLHLTDTTPTAIRQALSTLPEPWRSRLQRDPDQTRP